MKNISNNIDNYIIIDKRERPGSKKQVSLLTHYGTNVDNEWTVKRENENKIQFANLECGDVCFVLQGKPAVLLERKDIKDLAGCINSKSYKEQKMRMQKYQIENPQLKLIYLIEDFHLSSLEALSDIVNPMAPKNVHITKQTILSAIVSTMLRDGFFVHLSENHESTVAFIDRVYEKLPTYKIFNIAGAASDGKTEYLKQIDTHKSKNVDVDSWFLCALSQIPGVSIDKAKQIQEQYHNMTNLITEFQKCSENKRANMLTNVPKIGKTLSKRIYEYVCCVSGK
jgi:ERCC4-type nuclease